jgi:hypothetical protein
LRHKDAFAPKASVVALGGGCGSWRLTLEIIVNFQFLAVNLTTFPSWCYCNDHTMNLNSPGMLNDDAYLSNRPTQCIRRVTPPARLALCEPSASINAHNVAPYKFPIGQQMFVSVINALTADILGQTMAADSGTSMSVDARAFQLAARHTALAGHLLAHIEISVCPTHRNPVFTGSFHV